MSKKRDSESVPWLPQAGYLPWPKVSLPLKCSHRGDPLPEGTQVSMDCGVVVYVSSWHDQTRPFGGGEFLHKSEGYEGINSVRKPRWQIKYFRQRDSCAIDRPFLPAPTLWQHEYFRWKSCPNPQLSSFLRKIVIFWISCDSHDLPSSYLNSVIIWIK